MKMQNAEMEFVSFEAQDIITTSGPGTLLGWFSGSVTDESITWSTFNEALTSHSERFYLSDANTYINLYSSTIDTTQGTAYYIIDSATQASGYPVFYLDAEGTNAMPSGSGYQNLADTAAILSWLQGITKQ